MTNHFLFNTFELQQMMTFMNLDNSNLDEERKITNNDLVTFSERLGLLSDIAKQNQQLPSAS